MLEKILKKLPPHERRITISTALTGMRILLVPVVVSAMISRFWGIAFSLFMVAALTDVLDGALARLRNEQTFLGAALDPFADKFLILSCFSTLSWIETPSFAIPSWFVLLLLAKELILVAGVIGYYMQNNHVPIIPTFLGKLTTLVQISFIMWIFACYFAGWVPVKTYYTILGLMMVLSIVSFIQYAAIGITLIIRNKEHKGFL